MKLVKILTYHEDRLILLYLGLIKPYKGVLELIEAFKQTPLNTSLLIIAGWSLDSNYWNQVKDAGEYQGITLEKALFQIMTCSTITMPQILLSYLLSALKTQGLQFWLWVLKSPWSLPEKAY